MIRDQTYFVAQNGAIIAWADAVSEVPPGDPSLKCISALVVRTILLSENDLSGHGLEVAATGHKGLLLVQR
jgi:hypothetical protein